MSVIRSDLDGCMTPADKFYMNHKSCCESHDCNQGRDCPNREPASQDAAFEYVLNILAGIGFIAALIAVAIWSLK